MGKENQFNVDKSSILQAGVHKPLGEKCEVLREEVGVVDLGH